MNLHIEISMISAYAPVAQLDRALDFESRGRGFESYPVRLFPLLCTKKFNDNSELDHLSGPLLGPLGHVGLRS